MAEDGPKSGVLDRIKDRFTLLRFREGFLSVLSTFFDAPVTYFKEKIVDPNQDKNSYPYYHRSYNRVPTIDECDMDDYVCSYEANEQYRRDKRVDYMVVKILKKRLHACQLREGEMRKVRCKQLADDVDKARENYFIKYGDLGMGSSVVDAYMKQKHRLIWERRNSAPSTSIPEMS